MILFLGTKPGKREVKKLPLLPCPHCQQVGTLTLVSQRKLAHIFWIPLVNLQSAHYVDCSHCKRVYTREEFTPAMEKALE